MSRAEEHGLTGEGGRQTKWLAQRPAWSARRRECKEPREGEPFCGACPASWTNQNEINLRDCRDLQGSFHLLDPT